MIGFAIKLMVLAAVLFIPCLIVGVWKKRPIWAFTVATIVLFITLVAPGLITTFQAMVIYGQGDPQLMVGGISQTIVEVLLFMIVGLPVLLIFQWFVLRRHERQLPKVDMDETFS